MKVCVLDMQPISPPVGGGRMRLLGLYHSLGEGIHAEYVGSYDWPGERARDIRLTPNLREVTAPLSDAHFAEHERLRGLAGGKVVIDTTFHQLGHLSPQYVARAAESARNADVVVFSHPWVFPLVRDSLDPSRQLIVYDSHNMEGYLRMRLLDDGGAGTEIAYGVISLERELCQFAPLILACSHEDRLLFHELYGIPCARIKLCPNGVFTANAAPQTVAEREGAKRRLNLDRPTAIFLGSGYQFNLEAANFIVNVLAPNLTNVAFVIAGGVAEALPEAVRRKPPSNVRVTGTISEEEKRAYLSAADIALNPMFGGSGTNLKMFDYLAAGLPVITTSIGARGLEGFEHRGFVVSDPNGFPEQIARFLSSAVLRDRFSKAGRELVEEQYSWERISPMLGTLLERSATQLAPPPSISIVLLTKQSKEALDAFVRALRTNGGENIEIIVVDRDRLPKAEYTSQKQPLLTYIHTDIRSAAAAANIGAFLARGELLVFVGDESDATPRRIHGLAACCGQPEIIGCGGGEAWPEFTLRDFVVRQETLNAAGGFQPGSDDGRVRLEKCCVADRVEDGRFLLLDDRTGAGAPANVAEWVGCSDRAFVREAGMSILGSAATPGLLDRFRERLESHECSRSEVLNEMLRLRNASGSDCEIVPLLPDLFTDESTRLVALPDLLSYDGESFVRNLYRQLLGRDCDEDGFASNMHALRSHGATKEDLIRKMLASAEAASAGVKVLGLNARLSAAGAPGDVIHRRS